MDAEHTSPVERLWTPWRMRYIGGHTREEGCLFCNRLASSHDIASLILYRGEHVFLIMNLYPYNTGHIMLVPTTHAADPAALSPETLREMGEILPMVTTALGRVLGCDGFNTGMNIGSIAGAGVADHLHQHIVPRWTGDANFMPILASTMVLPELIPVTYAKIRAELERISRNASTATLVVFNEDGKALLRDHRIPYVPLEDDLPVWKCIVNAIASQLTAFELAGWAGADSTRPNVTIPIALTARAVSGDDLDDNWSWVDLDDNHLDEATRVTLQRAELQLAPIE